MFNLIFSSHELFFLAFCTFFVLFTIRQFFISLNRYIILYHLSLFVILFSLSIGGGGVQNDAYERLKTFTLLEKNNQLKEAKLSPQNFNSMLRIDLAEFNNSDEFRVYLKNYDREIDRVEAVFVGWFLAFIAEVSLLLTLSLRCIISIIKHRKDITGSAIAQAMAIFKTVKSRKK